MEAGAPEGDGPLPPQGGAARRPVVAGQPRNARTDTCGIVLAGRPGARSGGWDVGGL